MIELIKLNDYPVRDVLGKLLADKTTKRSIIFATDTYNGYDEHTIMTKQMLLGFSSYELQPRVYKSAAEQGERTRKKAEVFTPAWIVNKMNNHLDDEWFGRENVFNTEDGLTWVTNNERIAFPEGSDWKAYVDSRRLEITCGEAPYIVSRYDSTTGELIPTGERIGLFDRKLRVVNENAADGEEWLKWSLRALQSVYGYEFQGDNLLIARINLLNSWCDYYEARFGQQADKRLLEKAANIIAWNLWQMNGLNDSLPYQGVTEQFEQLTFFEIEEPDQPSESDCRVFDWRKDNSLYFKTIKKRGKGMKFDYVIGNPPYQDDTVGDTDRKPPLYHLFMDASYTVSDVVELITPGRFLFNAGQTPKEWMRKMLSDEHFSVLYYEPDATKIFANTEIKGGVCISIRNAKKNYGSIGTFTIYNELNSIIKRMAPHLENNGLDTIISSQGLYKFSPLFFEEHPEAKEKIGAGTGSKIVSSVMEKLPSIFTIDCPKGASIHMLGRISKQRGYRYIQRKYIAENDSIDKYKLFIPEANNSGKYGETLTEPIIGKPKDGTADTYLSAGLFETEQEPINLSIYMKTKFFRALLGVKKVTQHCPPTVWKYVPLQDFTPASDIDWSKSVAEIDRQLYAKYGLSQDEINFIETHVKEME